jgi:hypothetical protein
MNSSRQLQVVSFLFLVFAIVFWPITTLKFQQRWDDQWMLFNFYTEGGFSFANLRRIFRDVYSSQYSPINQITYTFLYSYFGYNSLIFHTFFAIIHYLNSILVFYFVRNILLKFEFSENKIILVSLISALFFLIHPTMIESVAWISASKVLLFSHFTLLCIISYCKFLELGRERFYYISVCLSFIASGCKEQAAIVVLLLFLLDYFYIKHKALSLKSLARKVPFIVSSFGIMAITILGQTKAGYGFLSNKEGYSFFKSFYYFGYSFIHYLEYSFIPHSLSHFYKYPQLDSNMTILVRIYPWISIILLIIFFVLFRGKQIELFFMAFYIINLILSLHIIPIGRGWIVADRYSYLSIISIGYVMGQFYANTQKLLVRLVIVAYFIGLAIHSHTRVYSWYDSGTLRVEMDDKSFTTHPKDKE